MLQSEPQLLRSQLHPLLCMTLDKGILFLQLRFFVHDGDDGKSHLTVQLSGITFVHGRGGLSTTLDGYSANFTPFSAEGRGGGILWARVSSTKVSSSVLKKKSIPYNN